MRAPNLYDHYQLPAKESCAELGLRLAARDAQLSQQGYSSADPIRSETMIAYGILSEDANRAAYNEALSAGRDISWAQLEHLSNFGTWPLEYTGWTEPDPEPVAETAPQVAPGPVAEPYAVPATPATSTTTSQNPYGTPGSYQDPFQATAQAQAAAAHAQLQRGVGPVTPEAVSQSTRRPTSAERWKMGALDAVMAAFFAGAVATTFNISTESDWGNMLFTLFAVAFVVVPEMKWGGSPMKLLRGYRVRDVETGAKLTPEQVLKRNWFRLVSVIPGLGTLIGLIGGIVSLNSANPQHQLRAGHDRWAGRK